MDLRAGMVVEKIAEDDFGGWGRVPMGGRIIIQSVDADGCVEYEIDSPDWRAVFDHAETGVEAFDEKWFRVVS
jgi:hypothetical protein